MRGGKREKGRQRGRETETKEQRQVNSRRWRKETRNTVRWRDRVMRREGGMGPGSGDHRR